MDLERFERKLRSEGGRAMSGEGSTSRELLSSGSPGREGAAGAWLWAGAGGRKDVSWSPGLMRRCSAPIDDMADPAGRVADRGKSPFSMPRGPPGGGASPGWIPGKKS